MQLLSSAMTGAAAAVAALVPSSADVTMLNWCKEMGAVINPSARLITTSQSVAGRGVFAVDRIAKDEVIAAIPTYVMFHPQNVERSFPDTAELINDRISYPAYVSDLQGRDNRFRRLMRRIFGKKMKENMGKENLSGIERPWQAELTEYALAALKEQHPFATWIQQWKRDDPVHRLFQNGIRREDQESIAETANEIQQMVPDLPLYKIVAAINIRLEQYEAFKTLFSDPESTDTAAMFSTLCSRTLGITDTISGVVPFHDMINHSFEPNIYIAISKDGSCMELITLMDIAAGEELFLCYTTAGREYDEDAAVWMGVHWGIPAPRSEWKVSKFFVEGTPPNDSAASR